MLDDAGPQLVLTQEELRGVVPATQAEVIALHRTLTEIESYVDENLSVAELAAYGAAPRIRDLYFRLDRPSQGNGDGPSFDGQSLSSGTEGLLEARFT
jgi:hypothetical protein